MKKIQAIDIECPNCGAPIDWIEGGPKKVRCFHCNSSIVLKNLPSRKEKKTTPKNDATEDTKDSKNQHLNLSDTWAHASVILGIISLVSILFPIFCTPVNIVGIFAGLAGRHSSQKSLIVAGIIANSIALLVNIIYIIMFLTSEGL